MTNQKGFTLIELLLYVAIFAMVSGMFTGILVIILRVQGQQTGLIEVSNQLNFAMNRIQSLIRESSPSIAPTVSSPVPSSLTISIDGAATTIALAGTEIQVGGVPITTGKVEVNDLKFTVSTLTNPSTDLSLPNTYSVEIEMTISNNTTNPQNQVSRTLKSSASPIGR